MVAVSQLVLLITTKVVGTKGLAGLNSGLLGVGGAAGIAAAAIAALVVAAIAFATISLSKYFEFSIQMGLLAGATRASAEEFELLETEALRLGRTLGTFTATEAAEAMKILAFSGFEVNEVLAATEQIMKLAIATQIDLSMATDITARTLRTFGIAAEEVAYVTDIIAETFSSSATTVEEFGTALSYVGPIAASAGVSLEEISAAIAVLANVGIRGSKAGTQLRQVLARIQAPTSGALEVLKKLGVEMFSLSPAAQSTQRALANSTRELRNLESQMDSTKIATQELNIAMSKLNIDEAKNRLEIMKIRDKAADDNRDLTSSELDQIARLEAANDDLAISQQEISIQQQQAGLEAQEQKLQYDELSVSIEEQTELFNSQKGELKDIVGILKEFEMALSGLSDAQKIEALNTIFGIRAISGFQALLDNVDSVAEYEEAIRNSSGALEEQAAIVEQSAGVAWKRFTSGIETFMIEVGDKIAPILLGITDAFTEMAPAMDAFVVLIKYSMIQFALFVPLIDLAVWAIREFGEEIKYGAKCLGIFIGVFMLVLSFANPFIQLAFVVVGLIVVIGLLVRALKPVADYIIEKLTPAWEFFYSVLIGLVDFLKDTVMVAIDVLIWSFNLLTEALGPTIRRFTKLGNYLYEVFSPAIRVITNFVKDNKEIFIALGVILTVLILAPLLLIAGVIIVVIAAIAGLVAAIAGIIMVANFFYDIIIDIRDGVIDFIGEISNLIGSFDFLWEAISPIIERFQSFLDIVKEVGGAVKDLAGDIVSGDTGGVVDTLSGMIPGAAKGNLFIDPSITRIAEDEPEVAIPVSQLGGDVGSGNTISTHDSYTINLYPAEGTNGRQLLEELRDAIEDEQINKRGNSISG